MAKLRTSLFLSGLAVLPVFAHAQVVINEISYSPQSKAWIEIYNGSTAPIDLTTYKILDSGAAVNGHGISAISGTNPVPVGGYAVIGTSAAVTSFGVPIFSLFKAALAPNTSGDTFTLKNGSTIVTSAPFSSSQGANGDGNSLQLQSDGTWLVAAPTPGAINSSAPASTYSDSGSDSTSTTATTTDSTSDIKQQTNTEVSSYYSSVPITTVAQTPAFEVGAGMDRLAAVDAPLQFKAQVNLDAVGLGSYTWSFGDGALAYGATVSHSYSYPGEYVVVVNASSPAGQAVSRANVRVIPASLSLSFVSPDRIEISNDSADEINLFGRGLVSEGKTFIFPMDTIIEAGQKISFTSNITGLTPVDVSDVSIVVVGGGTNKTITPVPVQSLISEKTDPAAQLTALYTQKFALEKQISNLAQASVPVLEMTDEKSNSNISGFATATPAIRSGWLKTIKEFFFGQKS